MKHFLTLFALLTTSLAFGQESCPNVYDYNDNNTIDIEDFLGILGLFADDDTDDDGIWDSQDDCIDLEACNYAASPTEPCTFIDVLGECGGGCEGDGDGDGICDDEDDCVGVVDECGVCNGPGPTEVVIEDITILYDSLYAEQIDEWWVFEVGADTTYSITCAPSCGDPVSYQGYDYATILIGEQCWFAENLRSENYENGDVISSGLSDWEWANTSVGAVALYDETYGLLYNSDAMFDARGLCPSGWHVPSDGEWMTMEMALGMSESEANDNGLRGTDEGSQMKADYGWSNGGNGTNSSGFSGLPGGFRTDFGNYVGAGNSGYWWSSSGGWPWYRNLSSYDEGVSRWSCNPKVGFSVRCLQDSE